MRNLVLETSSSIAFKKNFQVEEFGSTKWEKGVKFVTVTCRSICMEISYRI